MIVERKYMRGGLALNYAEGPASGPPILFLHGLTDRWQFFQPILPPLSQRWHVYALDFRGHGASGHTPPYRYIDHISDVISFIENVVSGEVIIYGASLGGMVGLMVAARRPDLVKALVFGDANIKPEKVRGVMRDYHTFWACWKALAGSRCTLDELAQSVADMPISIPWRKPGRYGDGLDYISILNKALYLRSLDPGVLEPWARGGVDEEAFKGVMEGYDPEEIRKIECPVLIMQANMEKGGILADDEVEYALERIRGARHVYMPMYGHNLGLYEWETGPLMRAVTTFLEAAR